MRFSLRSAIVFAAMVLSACGDVRRPTTIKGAVAEGAAGAVEAKAPSAAGGFVIENSTVIPLRATASGRDYEIYVKTPPGYDKPENAGRRYPVLYLTDGPYTFQVASGLTRVPFNHGRFREFIIVGLSYARGEVPADSRRRDLTPWRDHEINGVTGGAEAYLTFLRQAVLPLVETRYRVDRADRTLAGQSYGGLFGLWVAFHKPELFRSYILTSPSIWFADRAILQSEAAYAASHKDLPARIYLATGSREHPGPGGCADCDINMVADQAQLTTLLKSRAYPGLEIKTNVVDDGFHETTFPIGLMQGLQWLYLKE
ncbi:alpha/beta hydrolase [Caulobacter sp. BP25]|uniref:alpha/beta hydrolase n=1 Tax=Caulobacter sp. BP25 TaxID=2048900 RepID=UPI00117CFC29|nr:alpha/beta hydrolase-fold protein [Caulobacter sp. BP25]